MPWTHAQESAITTIDKTLLVSAAAGSGKTATLTERIIRSLIDPDGPSISRMLVVTYTRAAAAELKVKISKALSAALAENPKNHRLAEQMMMLESAKICTIDSFYFDIVKSHATHLELSGKLRIADDAEMTILYRGEMERVIDEMYASQPNFTDFMDHFVPLKGSDQSADIFLSIYQSLRSYRGGIDKLKEYAATLKNAASTDFLLGRYGETTAGPLAINLLNYAINALRAACDLFDSSPDERLRTNYAPAFQNDLRTAVQALEAISDSDYQKAREILTGYQKIPLKGIRGEIDPYAVYFKDIRTGITAQLASLGKDYFSLSQQEISSMMTATADVIEILHTVLDRFERSMDKEKKERGICDFSDIRRYALRLLVDEDLKPTDIAMDYKARFDQIYIDEYQDVDEVQDLIFSAIATPHNRFMVGDIKQSIYGFRGADSGVFARYKAEFPLLSSEQAKEADGCSIFMSNNFRCDQNIIDFSNLVSSYLFENCGQSIGYRREDDLIFSKELPSEDYISPKVTVALTGVKSKCEDEAPGEEQNEKIYYEAEYIASEISNLLNGQTKADGTPTQPKDIAILVRYRTDVAVLHDILAREGIPVQSDEKHDFFENPDILLVLSLLSAIDNPRRDIPLAGTLRSPFYGFTFDELIRVRQEAESSLSLYDALEQFSVSGDSELCRKCYDFMQSLAHWRKQATILPVSKLLQKIYREFSILALAKDNKANVLRLYDYARHFEQSSFHGLYSFISYINETIENGVTLDGSTESADTNAVRIMTMHHSKGLEFPVCFIYGAGKSFLDLFKREKIQFDASLGLGLQLHDSTGFAFTDTPVRKAILDRKLIAERQEDMRVLYVAMTRARERLYITAKIPSPEKLQNKVKSFVQFGKAFGIYSASSYLEWIFAAMEASKDHECYEVVTFYDDISPNEAKSEMTAQGIRAAEVQEDKELTELYDKRFSFVYPYAHICSLPAKLSVSALYPAVLDESELKDMDAASLKDTFVYPEQLVQADTASGAERGTATHTFLQFCDFDYALSNGVGAELDRLLTHRFIDERTARLCNVRQLEQFFDSELFRQIKNADTVWREQRFQMFLPASEFTQIEQKAELLEGETIAVQGVIDLFFRDKDGNIILVDYKTDFLTAEELQDPTLAEQKLKERHGEQLSYYQRAIEQMFGAPPAQTVIYSLPLAKSIIV